MEPWWPKGRPWWPNGIPWGGPKIYSPKIFLSKIFSTKIYKLFLKKKLSKIFLQKIFCQKYSRKKIICQKYFWKNYFDIYISEKKVGAKPPCCPQGLGWYRAIARSQPSILYFVFPAWLQCASWLVWVLGIPAPAVCISILSVYWHLPDCDCFCSAAPLCASLYTHTTKMDLPRRGQGAVRPHNRGRQLQLETNLREVWSFTILHSVFIDS